MEHDHDLQWLIELLEYRIKEMGSKERTLNLKFSKDSAKLLLKNLTADSADASDAFLAQPPKGTF